MIHNDELLDLVNEQDQVIGQEWRSIVHKNKLNNFRSVNAFIKNSDGKLWIPLRTAHKRLFPSCLDFSMGGHVSAGEAYEEAFRRETEEELNIDINKVPFAQVGNFTPTRDAVSCFMHVYEIFMDTSPNYNLQDYVSFEWLSPRELLEKIENGTPAKGDLSKIVRKLYSPLRSP